MLKKIGLVPIVCLLACIYFIYHGIEGNRGIKSLLSVKKEITKTENMIQIKEKEKDLYQKRVDALSGKQLDLDTLEESAFRVLNMGQEEAIVITK